MSYCINLALDAQEPHPALHPVAYHQQNRRFIHVIDQRLYCGAAAAQMILDSIGSGLLDQDDLYTINNSNSHVESGWHSGPDGVAYTLETLKPHSFPETFQYTPSISEEAISRKICWSIHHYGVAPIALVFGNEHSGRSYWILRVEGSSKLKRHNLHHLFFLDSQPVSIDTICEAAAAAPHRR